MSDDITIGNASNSAYERLKFGEAIRENIDRAYELAKGYGIEVGDG